LDNYAKELRIVRIPNEADPTKKGKIQKEKKLYLSDPNNGNSFKEIEVKPDDRANLHDSSSRVLYYILDESITNPDLFTEMVQYLY